MSSEQVAASLRQKQSSLKTQRSSSVPQLRRSQQETQEIQQFIKTIFTKENLWFIRPEDQKNIVATLQEINQLNSELTQKCRSNEIFQRQATLFMGMSERIIHLCHCVHLCLEYGFYLTEPKGLRIADAVQIAWQGVQALAKAAEQQRWPLLPEEILMSPEQQQFVREQIKSFEPLAQKLLTSPQFKDLNYRLQAAELQIIYLFFNHVQKLLTVQDQILWAFLKQPQIKEPERTLDTVYKRLEHIQTRIYQYHASVQQIPVEQREELEQICVDLTLKLQDLHVPLEPFRFVDKHLKQLQQSFKESPNHGPQLLKEFREKCISDMKFIHFVSTNLNTVGQTLRQVQSILFNLSLAFGKVYDSCRPHTVSALFLARALKAVSGLLERGDRIAHSTEKVTWQLQTSMEGRRLFHLQVEEGILSALRLMRDGRDTMGNYAKQLNKAIERLDAEPEMPSLQVYQILNQAYDERDALSGAAFSLGNVYELFQSIVTSLQQAGSFFPKGFGSAESDAAGEVKEMQRIYAGRATSLQQHLQDSWRGGNDLVWMIEQLLDPQQQQQQIFGREMKEILEPVQLRLATLAAQAPVAEARTPASVKKEQPKADPSQPSASKMISKLGQSREENRGRFEPYESDVMGILKRNILTLRSRQARMILEVLEKSHTFTGYVERVGRDFDPEEPASESKMMDTLLNDADTLWEFLKGVAEAKVLAYGFFNASGVELEYSEDRGDFIVPRDKQRHLRFSEGQFVSPKELMMRFLDVVLGRKGNYHVSQAVPKHMIQDMESIFLLPASEQEVIRNVFPE